jgi:hypothetical protein
MLWRAQGVVITHTGVHWACWAHSGLANASLARAQAVQGDDQQGQVILQDKVKGREEDQRG